MKKVECVHELGEKENVEVSKEGRGEVYQVRREERRESRSTYR